MGLVSKLKFFLILFLSKKKDYPFFSSSPCFTSHSFWDRST